MDLHLSLLSFLSGVGHSMWMSQPICFFLWLFSPDISTLINAGWLEPPMLFGRRWGSLLKLVFVALWVWPIVIEYIKYQDICLLLQNIVVHVFVNVINVVLRVSHNILWSSLSCFLLTKPCQSELRESKDLSALHSRTCSTVCKEGSIGMKNRCVNVTVCPRWQISGHLKLCTLWHGFIWGPTGRGIPPSKYSLWRETYQCPSSSTRELSNSTVQLFYSAGESFSIVVWKKVCLKQGIMTETTALMSLIFQNGTCVSVQQQQQQKTLKFDDLEVYFAHKILPPQWKLQTWLWCFGVWHVTVEWQE